MNRIAVITGVSRLKGIGKAICIELAKKGHDIFFTYWREYDKDMPWNSEDDEPQQIEDEIKTFGVQCHRIELDLSKKDSVSTLFKEVKTTLGNPSILINNATYSKESNINNLTLEELDMHYAVNVRATTMLTLQFIKEFKEKNHGRIINLSSGQSLSAMSEEIAYAITKGAIETLTKTLGHEIASKGITINAVNPGLTDSGWMDEDLKKIFLDRCPMGRFGKPEDAAKLIAFLVSKDGGWVTGQIIHSEGGFIREKYD